MEAESGGSHHPWWTPRANTDDMTYECDARLGSPREIDCSKLEYSQLGAPSDTTTISPGAPKVLSTSMEVQESSLLFSADSRRCLPCRHFRLRCHCHYMGGNQSCVRNAH